MAEQWIDSAAVRSSTHFWSPTRMHPGLSMKGPAAEAEAAAAVASVKSELQKAALSIDQENVPHSNDRRKAKKAPRTPLGYKNGQSMQHTNESIVEAAPTIIPVSTSPKSDAKVASTQNTDWLASVANPQQLANAPPIVQVSAAMNPCPPSVPAHVEMKCGIDQSSCVTSRRRCLRASSCALMLWISRPKARNE